MLWRVSAARSRLRLGERRLVHQQVGVARDEGEPLARRRVARNHDAPSRPRRADYLVGGDAVDRLATLEAPEVGPGADTQRRGRVCIEAAGALVLDERVAEARPAVLDRERLDLVAVERNNVVPLEHVGHEVVGQPAQRRHHRAEQPIQAARAVDRQWPIASVQRVGVQQAGQPEPVIGVVVGEEDRIQIDQPDRADELALGPLATVEEECVAVEPRDDRRQVSAPCGHRSGGPGEEDREGVHGSELRG